MPVHTNKEKIIEELMKSQIKNGADLADFKRKISKEYKISCPSNIELLKAYHKFLKEKRIKKSEKIEKLLRTRPVRSLSGIVNISVLTKPYPCPGKCVFCPFEREFPKSYVAGEPAAERAKRLKYDPYLQVKKRVEMLQSEGHPTDKIELRIAGGTWSFYPKKYQTWFIKRCFQAANASQKSLTTPNKIREKLEQAQKRNESAKNRIVGISIETRPDFITKEEILRLRKLGVTLVELGVQTVFDDILKKCQTGLTAKIIAKATRLLKDAGFKVLYQVMPNLPSSNPRKDLKCFKIIFQDEEFKPDWLKIYPCIVCKNTLLYRWWKRKKHTPYSNKELIDLLISIKKLLPFWVRLTRLFRDIPTPKIAAGCKILNLREVVQRKMKEKGLECKCIRCREVRKGYNPKEKIYLFRESHRASGGKEIFLSFENKKRTKLLSYLRLRIPSFYFSKKPHFMRILEGAAIIREIQTLGPQVPISGKKIAPQHRGLGKKLIEETEKIAEKEFGLKKIAVISGVGVRGYYSKLEYRLEDTYMIKRI